LTVDVVARQTGTTGRVRFRQPGEAAWSSTSWLLRAAGDNIVIGVAHGFGVR